jgi:hypothetical protein
MRDLRARGCTLLGMSGSVVFCPRCGVARTGPVCTNCGYDFVQGAKTPAVTLQRGINPVSLVMGLVLLAVLVGIVFFLTR